MIPKGILILAPLLGVLLAGCQSSAGPSPVQGASTYTGLSEFAPPVTSASLKDIRVGMAKAQVLSILGTPDSTSAEANAEYMIYYLELPYHVDSYRTERPYIIRLVGGKIESFGSYAELYDLYNRPVTRAVPGQPGFPNPAFNLGNPRLPPPTVVRTAGRAATVGFVEGLETLRDLRDHGVLNSEEFQAAKARLLALP
jgi:hypothetical protein